MNDGDVLALWAQMQALWGQKSNTPDADNEIALRVWVLKLREFTLEKCTDVVMAWKGAWGPTPSEISAMLDPKADVSLIQADFQMLIHRRGGLQYFGEGQMRDGELVFRHPEPEEFSSDESFVFWSENDWAKVRQARRDDYDLTYSDDPGTTLSIQKTNSRKDIAAFQERVSPAVAKRIVAEYKQQRQLGAGDGPAELGQ